MYRHEEENKGPVFSLHDCRAQKMNYCDGKLSFGFPDGFRVTPKHPLNDTGKVVSTDESRVEFQIIDEKIFGVTVYVFRENENGETVRILCDVQKFSDVLNDGEFEIEFVDEYRGYRSYLFKCFLWFDKEPYHCECEISFCSEEAKYSWNKLRYDSFW